MPYQDKINIEGILNYWARKLASDIHLSEWDFPAFRVYWKIWKLKQAWTFTKEIMLKLAEELFKWDNNKIKTFYEKKDIDFAYVSSEWIPFRVNWYFKLWKMWFSLRRIEREAKKMEDLWLPQWLYQTLGKKQWLFLVTWPTGSGKSTTLFSILNYFNPLDYNISTLEDPVEYNIPYINQTQIRPDIWFDFASWLRSLVRQDPNIIMVWEIRDKETAMLAIEAALTWHLVLSTIHTNSASATIQRLMNMWIEPFLIASALKLVISQRLIKKICQSCKQKYKIKEVALENKIDWYLKSMNISEKAIDLDFYNPVWCDKCNNSWYLWRIWVHEVLVMQEELDSLILNKSSVNEIEDKAEKLWMITIMQDWILKAATGKTTIEEVLKLI